MVGNLPERSRNGNLFGFGLSGRFETKSEGGCRSKKRNGALKNRGLPEGVLSLRRRALFFFAGKEKLPSKRSYHRMGALVFVFPGGEDRFLVKSVLDLLEKNSQGTVG